MTTEARFFSPPKPFLIIERSEGVTRTSLPRSNEEVVILPDGGSTTIRVEGGVIEINDHPDGSSTAIQRAPINQLLTTVKLATTDPIDNKPGRIIRDTSGEPVGRLVRQRPALVVAQRI